MHRKTGEVIIEEGESITQDMIEALESEKAEDLLMPENEIYNTLKRSLHEYERRIANS